MGKKISEIDNESPTTAQWVVSGLGWFLFLALLSLAFVDIINTRDRLNTTLDFFLLSGLVTFCVQVLLKESPRKIVMANILLVVAACIVSETIAYWFPLSRFRPGESRPFTYGMITGLGIGLTIRLALKHWPDRFRFNWTRPRVIFSIAGALTVCYLIRLIFQLAATSTFRNPLTILSTFTFDFPVAMGIVYVGIPLWIGKFIENFWIRCGSILLAVGVISATLRLALPSHSGFNLNGFVWAMGALSLGVILVWLIVNLDGKSSPSTTKANWNLVAFAWIIMGIVFGGFYFGYTTYQLDRLFKGEFADAKFHQKFKPHAKLYFDADSIDVAFEDGHDKISRELLEEFLASRTILTNVRLSNIGPEADLEPLSGQRLTDIGLFGSSPTWKQFRACTSPNTGISLRKIDYARFVVPENASPLKLNSLWFPGDHDPKAVVKILELIDEKTSLWIELPDSFADTIPAGELKKKLPKARITTYN